jgi:pilus assembly protein CpaB
MRAMFGLVLVAGVGLAGAAVYMAKGYISKTESALQKELAIKAQTGGLVEVYVVTKTVDYGDPITKEDVQKSYLPKNTLPEATFGDIALLFPEDNSEPRYVLRPMEKFEPILAIKVTEPGEQAGLTGALEKGMRAFAIKVEAADFLQPGDRVDIYWTGATESSTGEITRLIESTMKIIAVDRNGKSQSSDGSIQNRTMTVAATSLPALPGKGPCTRKSCATKGQVPVGTTSVTQWATLIAAKKTAVGKRVTGKCKISKAKKPKGKAKGKGKKAGYTCKLRLSKGTWTITTQAKAGSVVVAQTVVTRKVK